MDAHLTDETLNEYLDAALTTAQEQAVATHLSRCSACVGRLEALRVLFARLEGLPSVNPERDMTSAVMAALRATPAAPVVPTRRRHELRLVLAAEILGAALLLFVAWPFVASQLSRAPGSPLLQPAEWFVDLTSRGQAALSHVLEPMAMIDHMSAAAQAWLSGVMSLVPLAWYVPAGLHLPSIEVALVLVAAGAIVWLAGSAVLLRQPIAHLLRRRQ